MKRRVFLFLLLFALRPILYAQEQDKRMVFILLIDNEVPVSNIFGGVFLIADSTGPVKDTIPFEYQVGSLRISHPNYEKLRKYLKRKIIIDFKYNKLTTNNSEVYEYKEKIPEGWLNEEYMIFKVYNYFNPESRRKYALNKNCYGIEIAVPGAGSVFPKRGKRH